MLNIISDNKCTKCIKRDRLETTLIVILI